MIINNNMDYEINRKVWQILWDAIMYERGFGYGGEIFENKTFEYKPYSWDDEPNDYHFYHKPSGFKIEWYKYAMRGAYCNADITDSQFVDILWDCANSLEEGKEVRVLHSVDKWWEESDNIDE